MNLSKGLRQEAEDEEALLYRERIEEGLLTGQITDGYGRPFIYVPYSETNGYGSITALGWHGKEGGDFFDLNKDYTVLFDEVGLFTFEGTNRVYWRKD